MNARQKPAREPPSWLRALGRNGLPDEITVADRPHQLVRTYKHDFFAATGLYSGPGGRVVLKVGRQASFVGIPLAWIGRFLMRREARLFERTEGMPAIPRFLGTWGETGILHEYIEGRPLTKRDEVNDQFFPCLEDVLTKIHALDVAYVDLEKPENILRGEDGRPYLFDFQISWYLPPNRGGHSWAARMILKTLQASDRYHLLKHWRRIRPDQLNETQIAESYRAPFWIAGHRILFRPMTRLRRQILVWLGARQSTTGRSPG
ncbi:MAG: hypothetical protein MI923_29410 [Phycisphaerales bacterium]|nr:hypothetical protein [Phycisphaerales bacterium]